VTELVRFNLGTLDVDSCEGKDGEDVSLDANEEHEASQVIDGSMQNVDDGGYSRFDL